MKRAVNLVVNLCSQYGGEFDYDSNYGILYCNLPDESSLIKFLNKTYKRKNKIFKDWDIAEIQATIEKVEDDKKKMVLVTIDNDEVDLDVFENKEILSNNDLMDIMKENKLSDIDMENWLKLAIKDSTFANCDIGEMCNTFYDEETGKYMVDCSVMEILGNADLVDFDLIKNLEDRVDKLIDKSTNRFLRGL